MTKVFVNAVSIKSGGGKTILESFVNEIQNDSNYYIIYSGYKCPSKIPKNVKWVFSPLSGFIACLFNLFLSGFFFTSIELIIFFHLIIITVSSFHLLVKLLISIK